MLFLIWISKFPVVSMMSDLLLIFAWSWQADHDEDVFIVLFFLKEFYTG